MPEASGCADAHTEIVGAAVTQRCEHRPDDGLGVRSMRTLW
jgi:hypothetical protein